MRGKHGIQKKDDPTEGRGQDNRQDDTVGRIQDKRYTADQRITKLNCTKRMEGPREALLSFKSKIIGCLMLFEQNEIFTSKRSLEMNQ